jgi:hypothetical protein
MRFVTADGFISKAIRQITNSLFSHVEFGTPEGHWIGAHTGDGVQERAADYCTPTREYVYEIPVSQEVMDAHLKRIRFQIGTHYNNLDILGLLVKNRKLTTLHSVICSQFVSDEMLCLFGARKYLNVLAGFTYLITPETCHLSPVFVGCLVKKVG